MNEKVKKNLCNVFCLLEGLYRTKAMSLLIGLCMCKEGRYKNANISYNYTLIENAKDARMLKF